MAEKPSIMIIDDHPLVRDGLAQLLTAADFEIAALVEDYASALANSAFASCNIFIVDLSLAGDSGLELVRELNRQNRLAIVYSMHETANVVKQAFEAGANGYVTKRESPAILIEAITAVLSGIKFYSPRIRKLLAESDPVEELSDQQKQIFIMLGMGLSNNEIAGELKISVRTLESYCVRIMNKLNVDGTKQLRQMAIAARNADPLKDVS